MFRHGIYAVDGVQELRGVRIMKTPSPVTARVTVAPADWPGFTAAFGMTIARTGRTVDGLPECDWLPTGHQTPEQAQACFKWVSAGGGVWRADGVQQGAKHA